MKFPEVITPETLSQFSFAVDDLYNVTERGSGADVTVQRMIKSLTHRMAVATDQDWDVTADDQKYEGRVVVILRLGHYSYPVGLGWENTSSGRAAAEVSCEGLREAMREFLAPFTALALNTANALEAAERMAITLPLAVTDFIATRGVRPDPQWREAARQARATALKAMGTARN
jgi:hypothetical protein